MHRHFLGTVLFVVAFAIAPEAKACWDCCVPPPYTRPVCCSSICGETNCVTTGSGSYSFCAPAGDPCSSNEEYCRRKPYEKEYWVRCAPLSEKWQLVAVRITRTPAAKAAAKG
ncbi:MAG TPA: hypothetical protein VEK57_15835 [Thermoanaerobaculia bacterium]|nr:hypothetical protein [Thermoanaerobaculia bacterium]